MVKNRRKLKNLSRITSELAEYKTSLETISNLTKFNFSYLDDSQKAGQSLEEWNNEGYLLKLCERLVEFSKKKLIEWKQAKKSKKSSEFSIYEEYPARSKFKKPSHVPEFAKWARFTIQGKVRIIGFIVPNTDELKNIVPRLDFNTFYVVFLDKSHEFYIQQKR